MSVHTVSCSNSAHVRDVSHTLHIFRCTYGSKQGNDANILRQMIEKMIKISGLMRQPRVDCYQIKFLRFSNYHYVFKFFNCQIKLYILQLSMLRMFSIFDPYHFLSLLPVLVAKAYFCNCKYEF